MNKFTLLFFLLILSFQFSSLNSIFSQEVFVPQINVCRNGLNIAVPDNSPVGAKDSIRIPQIDTYEIIDVNVKIDTFIHTYDSDMSFTLTHRTNTVLIVNQVGGSGDNFIGTYLDDSSITQLINGSPPFTGSFLPMNPLSAFSNTPTSGSWVLLMQDHSGLDSGFLKAWCIKITYKLESGIVQTTEIPNHFRLYQNYPNPFNPVTQISFGLPKASNVKLTIFDINGKTVKILVNGFRNQGTYNETFDATDIASGIYFYKLEVNENSTSNEFVETKKMVLIK